MSFPFRAEVNLAAVRHNVATVRGATTAQVMAVIKADAYGHGAVGVARAAVEAGATWLGVAQVAEAVPFARLAPEARIFSWMYTPATDLAPAIEAGIDLSAGSVRAGTVIRFINCRRSAAPVRRVDWISSMRVDPSTSI